MRLQSESKKKALPPLYKTLASVLREGKDHATTTKDIMMLTGIKDKRQIHEMIERLINEYGFVIGASRRGKSGYYIISNDDELTQTLRTYNAQIQSMLKRYRNLQKNYQEHDQLEV